MKQKAVQKLIEYFEQQLKMQRESKIKYTGEEAYLDALDICKNAYKTMSKQQTAVEWLIEQLQAPCRGIPSHIIEQAKKMDKVEKEYFFNCGRQYQLTGEGTFTEVYNETYKTE